MKKAPTIDDVAKKAGYSKATVSAVINDADTVRESTREKILAVMDELNYRPRGSARRWFRDGASKSIGVIIKEVDNPYFASVVAGAREYANTKGYTVLMASSEGDYDAEQRIVNLLKSKDVDGLIIGPLTQDGVDLSYLFDLKRRNFPFVLMADIRGVQASIVSVDNVAASKRAVQELIAEGHSRVMHFAGPHYSSHSRERRAGVRAAYSESHLAFADDLVIEAGADLKGGYDAGRRVFGTMDRSAWPTAVMCFNDLVALGLLRALTELGISVPDDVSVVGFDDLDLLPYLPVPLTSVHVPKRDIGRKAAETLISSIESNGKLAPKKIYIDADLVRRSTTASRDGRSS